MSTRGDQMLSSGFANSGSFVEFLQRGRLSHTTVLGYFYDIYFLSWLFCSFGSEYNDEVKKREARGKKMQSEEIGREKEVQI